MHLGSGDPSAATATDPQHSVKTLYDPTGNLTFDGTYVYQYDAWNRLVQVSTGHLNAATTPGGGGSVGPDEFTEQPNINDYTADQLVVDALVKQYSYDGLGRLIRTVSPWPNPTFPAGEVRSERFYYDGLRRIQEVVLDPTATITAGLGDDDFDIQQASQNALANGMDGSGSTLELEQAAANPSLTRPELRIDREYIWGPGDGFGGPDELLVQFGPQPTLSTMSGPPSWVLQDAGGDNVALCDLGGVENGNPVARVTAQFGYDACGSVLTTDHLAPHPRLRCGHKSQFIDRLDIGVAHSVDPPRLVPFAHAVHHVRNRAYSPKLGRWLQADPNASGMTLMESLAYHGRTQLATASRLDLEALYADGVSLYAYLASQPWGGTDCLGLYGVEDGFEDSLELAGLRDPLPGPSDFIRETLKALVEEYAANLDFDSEWASDWELADHAHTRKDNNWVVLALGRGLKAAFDIDLPFTDESYNPLDHFASRKSNADPSVSKGGKISRFGGINQKITWSSVDGREFRATRYTTEKRGSASHPYVHIYHDSRLETVRDLPRLSSSQAEIRWANQKLGKPANHDWSTEYGFPCTWHHDHINPNRMYLIPRDLHRATFSHTGRAQHIRNGQ